MKGTTFLLSLLIICFTLPAFALTSCPRCGYKVGRDTNKCPKCLFQIDTNWSQEIPVRSTITVRSGYDAFIRHPQADNRAYKSNKNSGGDKTGEIGVWGGPASLRYLIRFRIDSAMDYYGINHLTFKPKKAFLYISTIKKKSELEIPIVVYPLSRNFTPGFDIFRERKRIPTGCTWYNATATMPWQHEGGDFEQRCFSRGVLKSGTRNQIDVTNVIKYFFEKSKRTGEWDAPGFIIMSDPSSLLLTSGFVTIYSFNTQDYHLRPELFIQ